MKKTVKTLVKEADAIKKELTTAWESGNVSDWLKAFEKFKENVNGLKEHGEEAEKMVWNPGYKNN